MEVTPQEIISTVQKFPISVQEEIIETLQRNLRKTSAADSAEDEIERMLLTEGLISEIPGRRVDEEEIEFVPVAVSGKALSETILEDRE